MRENVKCLSGACLSEKEIVQNKLKLTYSELFFSAERHAGNIEILIAAQRAGISTSYFKLSIKLDFSLFLATVPLCS